jgi:hypothetical protein
MYRNNLDKTKLVLQKAIGLLNVKVAQRIL